jgi:hypothetical protein
VVPPGTYDINVTPQIFDRIVPEIQYGIVVNNNIVLNFNLVAGSILSGTVERSGGSGVPGVDIDVFHYSNGIKLFTPDDNTDQLGFFQIVLPHGNFNIEVEVSGWLPLITRISLSMAITPSRPFWIPRCTLPARSSTQWVALYRLFR